jgi:hypothetical protein
MTCKLRPLPLETRTALLGLLTALTVSTTGCSDDSETSPVSNHPVSTSDGNHADAGPSLGGDAGESPEALPARYAMAVIVLGPNNSSTTYVSVFDSLDVKSIDLKHALEFPGQADIAAFDGRLYVSSGEEATITRYSIAADGSPVKDQTLSFAHLGLTSAPLRSNTFINAHKAYLLAPNGQHAIWDPTAFGVTGVVDIPDMTRGESMLDGSSGVLRGNRLYRTFYWEDWLTYTFSEEQYIATYNTDTDELISLEPELRCPNLGAAGQIDEAGTIYFSNWFYNVPGTLMKGAPASCVVRINSDTDAADPDWTLTFNELTAGHEGAQLSYLSKGKAVFSAVHEEDIAIEADTPPYEITGSPNWETWSVDLATRDAAPVKGIGRMTAQQNVFELNGRSFLVAPNDEYTESTAYEILADGTARVAFTAAGFSRGLIQIQ